MHIYSMSHKIHKNVTFGQSEFHLLGTHWLVSMSKEEEPFLIAPVANSDEFYAYKIIFKPDSGGKEWQLDRSIIKTIPEEHRQFVVKYPAGSVNQNLVPQVLRNFTVLDSRSIGKMPKRDIFFDLLGPLLREFGIHYVYVATTSLDTLRSHASSFTDTSTVTVIGGDTSLHEFVNALPPMQNKSVRFVVIPAGSGNALANSLGTHTPIHAIQRLFLSGLENFVPLMTFPVQFPHITTQAIVVASWGLHSRLVADADTPEMRERYEDATERFQVAARKNLDEIEQKYSSNNVLHSYLLFTCVSHLEESFNISPLASPPLFDKLFRLWIGPYETIAEQKTQLMKIMMSAYDDGKHIQNEEVEYDQVVGTAIITVDDQPEPMRQWCVDGKIVVCPPGQVKIGQPQPTFNGWKLLVLPG